MSELMRQLREALQLHGLHLTVVEQRQGKPYRWALTSERVEEPEPEVTVPLPHVVAHPTVRTACMQMRGMARYIIMLLAAAGERGMDSEELTQRLWPIRGRRPTDPCNAISAHISMARPALARHGLAVVARPKAGVGARRYLVRTR
jgi:hypothetical protein